MRDRSIVVARKVTRYFVYGRGYNSNLAAHIQLAKRYIDRLEWADFYTAKTFGTLDPYDFTYRWYEDRYPARPECNCAYCSFVNRYSKSPSRARGCWMARMAEYRQVAREIIAGKRSQAGYEILPLPAGTLCLPVKALPHPGLPQCCEFYPNCTCRENYAAIWDYFDDEVPA